MVFPLDFPHIELLRGICRKRRLDAFVVGGFLRCALLKVQTHDVDFAVSHDAVKLAKSFAAVVKGAFVLLDDGHGSARVVKKAAGETWTYDFTDLRAKGIKADLHLRDLTINTFCCSLLTGADHSLPQAAKDLKDGRVRMVAARAFTDDPLRLMRVVSVFAQTGFKVEPATLAAVRKLAGLISTAAMERTREELFKVLSSPRAHAGVLLMEKTGLLLRVMPQVEVMFNVAQGGYHHLDVWRHSLLVMKEVEALQEESATDTRLRKYLNERVGGGHTRGALLKLAALLHDIGKPATRKQAKDRMTFHGHEHVGAGITRYLCKQLKLSVKERYWLEDAVRAHLRPGYLSNFKQPSRKAVFRYMRDTGSEAAAVAMLAIADQRATLGPKTTKEKALHHEATCRMLIEEYFKVDEIPKKERLLTGHDLIKKLKLNPSLLFAKILTAVEEEHALGKITTKEEALDLAKKVMAE